MHHKFLVEIASIPIFLRNQFYFYDVMSIFHRDSPLISRASILKKRRSYSISAIYLQLPTSPAPHIPKPTVFISFPPPGRQSPHCQSASPNRWLRPNGTCTSVVRVRTWRKPPGGAMAKSHGDLRSTSMGGKNGKNDLMVI